MRATCQTDHGKTPVGHGQEDIKNKLASLTESDGGDFDEDGGHSDTNLNN